MKAITQKRRLLLTVIVAGVLCLFFTAGRVFLPTKAQAQLPADTGKNDVLVVPIQLDRDCYGLAVVDTTAQTLWIYEINNRGPAYNRLKLAAARSWQYDRLLEQYNTAEPRPEQVRALLEGLGRQKISDKEVQPSADVNTPPTDNKKE